MQYRTKIYVERYNDGSYCHHHSDVYSSRFWIDEDSARQSYQDEIDEMALSIKLKRLGITAVLIILQSRKHWYTRWKELDTIEINGRRD